MPSDKKETAKETADTLFGWLNRPHGMTVEQVETDWERCRRLLPDKYPVALAVPLRELLKAKRIARLESLIVDGVETGPRYVLAVTPDDQPRESPRQRSLF